MSETPAPATGPVCGMSIAPTSVAASAEHNGRTFYFCSTHCADRFHAGPDTYLNVT